MDKQFKLKQASIAVLGAIYLTSAGYAIAEIGMKKSAEGSFYTPTFTAEEVRAFNEQRKELSKGEIFVGSPGQLNRHSNKKNSTGVYSFDDSIKGEHVFIVQLHEAPVATYQGNIKGYPATKPVNSILVQGNGALDINSSSVKSYQSLLKQKQKGILAKAQSKGANVNLINQYTLANNAMAVRMTQRDAELLAATPGVKKITPSRTFELKTDRGAEFIGADSLWLGSHESGLSVKGEGMVVGIIDTGINTDHPAFASDEDFSANNPLGAGNFLGDCIEDSSLCNDKLIGVYSYSSITSVYDAPEFQERPWLEHQIRPENGEDYNGHGSHTASTAVGNSLSNIPLQASDGQAVSDGVDLPFTFDLTSGVAPRAHVVSYQVCYPGGAGDAYAGCPEDAILSAFEDAIKDGVDVINFSIGGGESFPWDDPMELAFLSAREAGISVAAAAGNSGPYFSSADHTSPWVTTVGASTHDRTLDVGHTSITAFEGDAASYRIPSSDIQGKGFTDELHGTFVLAENYPDPNPNDEYDAASCNVPFPAGTFSSDEIVVCERGDIPRVDKAVNVQAGGAGGIVLQNIGYSDALVADKFVIPGINVAAKDRYKIKNWIKYSSDGAAKGTITAHTNEYSLDAENGNLLALFSSLGPSRYIDNLVPDLTAPGVNIFAANADDQPFTLNPRSSDWTMMSGTSMASPHVAGAMVLLKQLHPHWSPAEIQSALMLTANEVKYKQNEFSDPSSLPYNFMAGSGAIDVAKAAETGLVMHETIENYIDANPDNGGIVNWLNLPSMVDGNCESECSWMRTVTATKDGSWVVSTTTKDDGSSLTVTPTEFTLKKGESRSILVTMNVPGRVNHLVEPSEPTSPWEASNDYRPYNGTVILTETSSRSPELHMPVVSFSKPTDLPHEKHISINRNSGSETFTVNTDDYSQFTPRVYGLVQPTTYDVELDQVAPFFDDDYLERGWDIQQIVVPEGTKRLIVEVQSTSEINPEDEPNPRYIHAKPLLTMGLDTNGNGTFLATEAEKEEDPYADQSEYFGEMVCQSSSESVNNYCNIVDPTPGTYWVAVTNVGYSQKRHNITMGYALLSEQSDYNNLTVEGPASHDGIGNYDITLNWDIPDALEGDVFYGGFDMGNMPGSEGTLGFTSVKINRGSDLVSFDVSQTQARIMDVVDITVDLLPNLETNDRAYDFTLAVPDGMRIVPETLTTSNDDVLSNIVVDEKGLSLSGTQTSTRDVQREYVVTNSVTDLQCKTPLIDEYSTGGYVDLKEFGLQPNQEWYVGSKNDYYDLPMEWLFWGMDEEQLKLYNQQNGGFIRMHAVGAMQFNTAYWSMRLHRGPGFLYESISPFWRGDFEMNYLRHPEDPMGLTVAAQYNSDRPDIGDMLFLEFDNVTDSTTGDQYDYQVIMSPSINFNPQRYEIMFAYDNLGANLDKGAVFIEGFDSVYSINAGPKDGYLYSMIGFDDLSEKLSDDLVICFDYSGPEASAVQLSMKAVVQPHAVGQTLDISMDYTIEGDALKTTISSINVPSNIKLADMPDLTVEEDGVIEGIEVIYVDSNKVANNITVAGENVTATVDGNSFTLQPNKDFSGETVVTVTVQDTEYASDSVSTSFVLTVTNTNDMPEAVVSQASVSAKVGSMITLDASSSVDMDGDNLSFVWDGPGEIANADQAVTSVSGLSVGTHHFTVTVSDGELESSANVTATIVDDAADSGSSGGSLGWLALTLLSLSGFRRRQK
ncbi:S8 family serine peptidase [Shewanella gaetbuli]